MIDEPGQDIGSPHDDKAERILEQIFRDALSEVDVKASYAHYLVFDEIKVIYKNGEQPCNKKQSQNG